MKHQHLPPSHVDRLREPEMNDRLKRMKERGVRLPWETHGTDPRDNPEGGEAKHHGGA